jgi:hypothetical protein
MRLQLQAQGLENMMTVGRYCIAVFGCARDASDSDTLYRDWRLEAEINQIPLSITEALCEFHAACSTINQIREWNRLDWDIGQTAADLDTKV